MGTSRRRDRDWVARRAACGGYCGAAAGARRRLGEDLGRGQCGDSRAVRCRGADGSLRWVRGAFETVKKLVEARDSGDRYDGAAGGYSGRSGYAHAWRVARLGGGAD